MSRVVFGDTDEGEQPCVMCCNLRIPSSDKVYYQRNNCDCQPVNTSGVNQLKTNL